MAIEMTKGVSEKQLHMLDAESLPNLAIERSSLRRHSIHVGWDERKFDRKIRKSISTDDFKSKCPIGSCIDTIIDGTILENEESGKIKMTKLFKISYAII